MPRSPSSTGVRNAVVLGLVVLLATACHHAAPRAGNTPSADDEVNVGYGTTPEERITGSVETLREKDFGNVRATRVEELIEGRVAGVRVVRLPDGGFTLRIRGTSSIFGSNEPLFVIDGMPVQTFRGGALTGLNPADIARIEVLKDAGSTAIYGSRGANGVILITTKRAR